MSAVDNSDHYQKIETTYKYKPEPLNVQQVPKNTKSKSLID